MVCCALLCQFISTLSERRGEEFENFTNELESELLLNSILTLTLSCLGYLRPVATFNSQQTLALSRTGVDSCLKLQKNPTTQRGNHLQDIYSSAPIDSQFPSLGASYLYFPFIRATKVSTIGHHLGAISNLFPFSFLSCSCQSNLERVSEVRN